MIHSSNALVPVGPLVRAGAGSGPEPREVSGELITRESFHVASRIRPLQTRSVITEFVKPGTTIEDAVKQIVVDPVLVSVAYVELNGRHVPREHWRFVRPRVGSLLTISCAPHNSDIARVALFVTLAVFAGPLAGSIWAGITGAAYTGATFGSVLAFGALKTGIILLGSLVINALIPPPKPDIDDPSEFPYLNGAGNRPKRFSTVPRVFGKHRMAADLAATSYTEFIDDKEQYLVALLCWGYGPIRLTNLRIGDTPISLYDGEEIEFEHRGVFSAESLPLNQTWDISSEVYPTDIHQEAINRTITNSCLLYTSPSPRDRQKSRMPSSA